MHYYFWNILCIVISKTESLILWDIFHFCSPKPLPPSLIILFRHTNIMVLFISFVLNNKVANLPSNRRLPFDCCQRLTHCFPSLVSSPPTYRFICLRPSKEQKQSNTILLLGWKSHFYASHSFQSKKNFQIKLPFFFLPSYKNDLLYSISYLV